MLQEHRFRNHGANTAGPDEPDNRNDDMEKATEQIEHPDILPDEKTCHISPHLQFATHRPASIPRRPPVQDADNNDAPQSELFANEVLRVLLVFFADELQ